MPRKESKKNSSASSLQTSSLSFEEVVARPSGVSSGDTYIRVGGSDEFPLLMLERSVIETALLVDQYRPDRLLDADMITTEVVPLLKAIELFHNTVRSAKQQNEYKIRVRAISQFSPIQLTLEGATEALKLIREMVTPWRNKHAQTIAYLQEQQLKEEIAFKRAEVIEMHARAKRGGKEAQKFEAEASVQRAESLKMQLEYEKVHLEVQRQRIQLALDVIQSIAPNMSEAERIHHVVQLFPSLETITNSKLQLTAPSTRKLTTLDIGSNPTQVMEYLHKLTGISINQLKDTIKNLPATVEHLPEEEAEAIRSSLSDLGATAMVDLT